VDMSSPSPSTSSRAAALVLACALAIGCGSVLQLLRARHQVAQLGDARFLRGSVEVARPGGELFVIALAGDRKAALHESDAPGAFWMSVPAGVYRVATFQDRNGDRVHQDDEPAALHPEPIDLREAVRRNDLRLSLPATGTSLEGLTLDVSDADFGVATHMGRATLGTIASIDDDRFSLATGRRGLWEPIRFMEDPGGGIFFLEPYDAERVPVLFVHGAGGSPSVFETLIAAIDRDEFQPWVVQYPSAMRLEQVADLMAYALEQLHEELGFERLAVVAHSMGGLVARAYLNDHSGRPRSYRVQPFVSIATPWAGHAAAEAGVARSPVVIPSWRDMAPSSHFLQGLFEPPLPEGLDHHLFFSFEGNRRRGAGGTNDGVVTVASQLSPAAQAQAGKLVGFAENHTSVLRSTRTAEALNAALREHD